MVHHGLECGRRICESKEHDHGLEKSSVRLERGLPLISVANPDVVVAPTDVELHKQGRGLSVYSRKTVHEFSDEGKWGRVVYSPGIKFAIVLDGSEVAVLLFDVEERECVWGFRVPNVSFGEVLVDELLQGNIFHWCERVDFAV